MDSKALTWACVGAVGAVALQYLLAGNPATLNAPPIAANARSRSTAAAAANGASVGGAAAAEEDEDDWEDIDTGDDDDDDDDEDDFRKGAIEHLSDDQGKAILASVSNVQHCDCVLWLFPHPFFFIIQKMRGETLAMVNTPIHYHHHHYHRACRPANIDHNPPLLMMPAPYTNTCRHDIQMNHARWCWWCAMT